MVLQDGNFNPIKPVLYGTVCLLCLSLAACGGSGGSGKSGGSSVPLAPSGGGGGDNSNDGGTTFTAADFETAEYNRQSGLRQMNASSAYAQGATGGGVTVAFIDTGIDVDHPDLAGQISNLSTDIVGGSRNDVNDTNGHGTAVAGVIAAAKNNSGTHGVAFDAQVMAIRGDDIDQGQCGNDGCDFFSTDTIAGINYAVANGARVINLSISGPDAIGANYRNALNNAGNQGVVVVAAAGNSSGVGPEHPAAFAADGRSVGNMLAVGSVDSNEVISSFSNTAGTSISHFVVAPGERIRTLGLGGGEVLASGTSFATPHVAGAAAVLIDLFPSLTAPEVVDLLRGTAADLGVVGDDAIYGKGLIDLQAAVAPQGAAQVPQGQTTAGHSEPLSGSGAQFAASFGDGPMRAASAGGLAQVLFLDDYKRGYRADLTALVGTASSNRALEQFVRNSGGRDHAALDFSSISSSFGFTETAIYAFDDGEHRNQAQAAYLGETNILAEKNSPGLSFTGGLSLGTVFGSDLGQVTFQLTQGDGMSVAGTSAKVMRNMGASDLFGMSDNVITPLSDMVAGGLAAGLDWQVTEHVSLSFSHHDDARASSGMFADNPQKMTMVGASYDGGANGIAIEVGKLQEQNSLLGSLGAGAFGLAPDAETVVGTISAYTAIAVPVVDQVTLFGRYTQAMTDISDVSVGLFSNWGPVRANAFSVGVMAANIIAEDDRLGMIIGQSLRVDDAPATLRVPKIRGLNGAILYDTQSVNLAPGGREISLELSYKTKLQRRALPDGTMAVSLFGRREPGHVAGAAPDIGLTGRISLPF